MVFLKSPSGWLRRSIHTATAPLAEPLLDSRPASRLIRSTARRQWHRLILTLILSLVQAGAEGATLGVIFLAVDLLSRSHGAKADLTLWSGNQLVASIPGLSAVLSSLPIGMLFALLLSTAVLLKLAQSLAIYASSINTGYFTARVNAEVTALIHHQILRLTLSCASRYPVGDLTYYASSGPNAVMTQINTASSFIVNMMMVAVYLIVLISLSPWLLCAAALMAIALILIQRELLPRIRRRAFEGTAIAVAINTRITENIQGLRLLHSSGQLEVADQALFNQMGELEKNTRANTKLSAVVGPVTVFLPMAMIALIAGLSLVVFGTRNSGILPSLVTFVVALQRLNGSFGSVASNFSSLNSNSAAIHRLNAILDPDDKQFRRLGGLPFSAISREITLENISLSYTADTPPAVRNVSLRIPRGHTVALVGASGAGKSSIADLIVGLYDPSHGRILIDDVDLAQIDLTSWQQRLGVVSQDTFLFNASIAHNIAFGTPGASPEAIEAAARKAQAHGFVIGMPSGYDTLIGERGYRLSGGQRQRISLARAILRDPELLILDEATSALDSQSERLVQEAIEQFERQHTVLVIAHRLSTIVNADLICVMDQGRIVERGTHQDLLRGDGIYANLWQQQVQEGRRALNPPPAIG
jgi:ATP-binding cassette subfamily B protein/subfamily B ATP-binding cassette protein MsbA